MWRTAFPEIPARTQDARTDTADVIRQFERYCPVRDLVPDPQALRISPVVRWQDYVLVRIVHQGEATKGPTVVYGAYAPGDLRPLDAEGRMLRELSGTALFDASFISLDALVADWQAHVSGGLEDLRHPERMPAALPMWNWDQQIGLEVFKEELKARGWTAEGTRIRTGVLPFYRTYQLLEIVDPGTSPYRRTYALWRPLAEGHEIRPLNGRSQVLHDANAETGELLLDTPERRKEYLRFFCWAIESDEGPFLLPRHRRELPFTGKLDPAVLERIAADMTIRELGQAEEEEATKRGYSKEGEHVLFGRLSANVAYGNALFNAWFKVEPTGGVTMVDDDPVIPELPLAIEKFGSERLPVLGVPPSPPSSTAVGYYGMRPPVAGPAPATIMATVFEDELTNGHVTHRKVQGVVTIDLRPSKDLLHREILIERVVFEDHVRIGGMPEGLSLRFDNCIFPKGVDGHLAQLGGDLRFEQCDIGRMTLAQDGPLIALDVSNASIGGNFCLRDCHVAGALLANHIDIDGSLLIWGCYIGGQLNTKEPHWTVQGLISEIYRAPEGGERDGRPVQGRIPVARPAPEPDINVDLLNANITGSLELMADSTERNRNADSWDRLWNWQGPSFCTVGRFGLRARGCCVGQDVLLGGSIWMGTIDMLQLNCKGTFRSHYQTWDHAANAPKHVGMSIWKGDISLNNAVICADLDLMFTTVLRDDEEKSGGDMDLRAARIEGRADLLGFECDADLSLDFCRIKGFLNAFQTRDRRTDEREVMRVGGDMTLSGAEIGIIELRGIRVMHLVKAITGTFGRVLITYGAGTVGSDGAFWPQPSRFGALELNAVQVAESLDLSGLQVALPEQKAAGIRRSQRSKGIALRQCIIGGDLLFFQQDLKAVLEGRWFGYTEGRPFWRDPAVAMDDAQGPINMMFPSAGTFATTWGDLDMRATRIGGHLDLRNMRIGADLLMNDVSVQLDIRLGHEALSPEWSGHLRTTCALLDAEKLQCQGDVHMTGLTVGSASTSTQHARDGHVLKARETRVRGEWFLLPPKTASQPRAKKMDPATIAQLHGSLDLAAAHINHLILGKWNFLVGGKAGGRTKAVDLERAEINRLEIVKPTPGPIDLSRVKVGRWEFDEETANADDFIDVLGHMDPFDRAVWIDVEKNFRNEGRSSDADRVYRAMRRAAIRKTGRPVGTRTELLLGAIVLALIVGLIWSSYQHRFVPLIWAVLAFAICSLVFRLFGDRSQKWFRGSFRNADDKGPFRWMRVGWHGLSGFPTDYGTRVWRPMLLWVMLLVPSFAIFKDRRNVELDMGPRVVLVQPDGTMRSDPFATAAWSNVRSERDSCTIDTVRLAIPELARNEVVTRDGDRWTTSDAAFLVLRYQVPVLDLAFHDEWTAGQREITWYGCSFTAEEWATGVKIYSFIAWSLLLIGLSVKVFRGKQG